jgi:hypothetical protein
LPTFFCSPLIAVRRKIKSWLISALPSITDALSGLDGHSVAEQTCIRQWLRPFPRRINYAALFLDRIKKLDLMKGQKKLLLVGLSLGQ